MNTSWTAPRLVILATVGDSEGKKSKGTPEVGSYAAS